MDVTKANDAQLAWQVQGADAMQTEKERQLEEITKENK